MRKTILHFVQAILFSIIFFLAHTNFIQARTVIGFNNFITTGLSSPVDITNAGDETNCLFIVEQEARSGIYFVQLQTSTGNELVKKLLQSKPAEGNNKYGNNATISFRLLHLRL